MGVDEEGTLAALKSHRRELIDPLIDQHRGRIVKTTGDLKGWLRRWATVRHRDAAAATQGTASLALVARSLALEWPSMGLGSR